jgi:hypothetical protein
LVPDSISGDTIEALQELLDDARDGRAIGIGFVVMYKGRRFIANAAGEAADGAQANVGDLAPDRLPDR